MKNKIKAVSLSDDKVPIQLSSNYFFERALKSLDKQRYDKALKYFKKAVDYEPENPINYCNVAGVLSEMGNYDQANDILKKVIQDIDPEMTEVYFYMATNFAHLEQYEEAESQLIHYLEEDEEGHFLEEAEEMIEFLQAELEEPKKITKVKAKAGLYEHSYARELLEQGQFAEAIALLEKIVEQQPDFLAAVNNLALAYYYVGFKEEAKHYMLQVLERDASNLHALCNLAIYYYYESEYDQLEKLLPNLIKVEPFYQEHLYKLATTLGIMKEHRGALKHFERLIRLGEGMKDGSIYHYAALASLNIKAYSKALRYWQLAYQYCDYELALFYIELTNQLKQHRIERSFTYSYFHTIEEQFALWASLNGSKDDELNSCIARAYFYYAKATGSSEQKMQSLDKISSMLDEAIVEQLYNYVLYPLEDKQVKRKALALLFKFKIDQVNENKSEQLVNFTISEVWQAIIEGVIQDQLTKRTEAEKKGMITLILNYLLADPTQNDIASPHNSWIASFTYLERKHLRQKVSFKTIAEQYKVSPATVSKRVKIIEQSLAEI